MKKQWVLIMVLVCGMILVLPLSRGAASSRAAPGASSSAASSAANNPLEFVEAQYDLGLDYVRSVAISPDGNHVYTASHYEDAVTVFRRDATTGLLIRIQIVKDGGGVNGLDGAWSVVVSPDGKNVYVASITDDAVAVFDRDGTTGLLAFREVHIDSSGEDGLYGARSVIVSPDLDYVYVAGSLDDAVAIFSRDGSTGALTYEGMVQDGVGGVDGLDYVQSVTASPDNGHIYAAGSGDNAVAIFSRDGDSLNFEGMVQDGVGGVDGLQGAYSVAVSPDNNHVYVTSAGGEIAIFSRDGDSLDYEGMVQDGVGGVDGLQGASIIIFGPGGHHVYVTGQDDNAIVTFSRDAGTGTLTYQGMVQTSASDEALSWVSFAAISSDGNHVYAVSPTSDSIAVFQRNASSGALSLQAAWFDAEGLEGAVGVAVSPDGNHVYVAGNDDDTVVTLARNGGTGALTYVWTEKDGVVGRDGLDGARDVAIDPNGDNVYVAGNEDDAIAIFERSASTGRLSYRGMVQDGVDGVDRLDGIQALTVSPDGAHVYAASQGEDAIAIFARDPVTWALEYLGGWTDGAGVDGLDGAYDVVVSPDGANVYVASYYDDAVVRFVRNPTSGALSSPITVWDDNAGVDGLEGANSLAISPDGLYLYVAGRIDDAVAVFERNPANGELTYLTVYRDSHPLIDGLDGARAVAVNPDGSQLYVASQVDHALTVFARNEVSGMLTIVKIHWDDTDGVDGLNTADGLAVSPDGGHIYVAGYGDDAVAVFGRFWVYLPLVLR